jgi:hypothetical protein
MSNSAIFAANKIMEYLTTICINNGSWHGSLENFLINWQEKFRRYESLVPSASHYKDEQKLAMLQVTIHPLCELQQVKNAALLIKQANSGKDLTYDEYVQLLTHAASDYNNVQIKAKGKRQVYIHEVNEDTLDMSALRLTTRSFIHYVHRRTTIYDPIGNDWIESRVMNLELI